MLIHIDENGNVTRVDEHQNCKILTITRRLMAEIKDWQEYKKLSTSEGERYTAIATQEFQHALVAMSDLLITMKEGLTAEESEQFNRFVTECITK